MKLEFKVGDKVRLKFKYKNEFDGELYGKILKVEYINGEDLRLSNSDNGSVFSGWGFLQMFEYSGRNVNNEAFELISNNTVKSFQAILEDGRIINISCLN